MSFAILICRIISTVPSAVFGTAVTAPVSTARAAVSASMVSFLPRRYRIRAVGPVDLEDSDARADAGTRPGRHRRSRCPRCRTRPARRAHPTRPRSWAYPVRSTGMVIVAITAPTWSNATATCACLWVSTPTMMRRRSGSGMLISDCVSFPGGVVTAHRAGGQGCDGTCCDQAPMRSLPGSARHLRRVARAGGQINARAPAGPSRNRGHTSSSDEGQSHSRISVPALGGNTDRPRPCGSSRMVADAQTPYLHRLAVIRQLLEHPRHRGQRRVRHSDPLSSPLPPDDPVGCPPDRCPSDPENRVVANTIIAGRRGHLSPSHRPCRAATRGFGSDPFPGERPPDPVSAPRRSGRCPTPWRWAWIGGGKRVRRGRLSPRLPNGGRCRRSPATRSSSPTRRCSATSTVSAMLCFAG